MISSKISFKLPAKDLNKFENLIFHKSLFKKNYLSMIDRAHPTIEFSSFIREDFFFKKL